MRKLDQFIVKSFIGPFVLTTAVSTFILLIQHMLKYFDDFVGKDLGISVFAELLFYFSLNMLQVALPLGVLVSSLMTFGNLGEHFELTAIKSSGISLIRALQPIFFFVVLISIGAFFFNDKVLPSANLKAYSLLYDIKHKKPTMDIQEGVFYKGIPDYTIKANEKFPDDITMKDVIIYDHTNDIGNRRVILADSCRMFLFMNDRYLKLELFNGNYYNEEKVRNSPIDQFYRTGYSRMDMVFSLASFEFDPTDEELFKGNRQMMDIKQLTQAIDSMKTRIVDIRSSFEEGNVQYFSYFLEEARARIIQKRNEDYPLVMDGEDEKILSEVRVENQSRSNRRGNANDSSNRPPIKPNTRANMNVKKLNRPLVILKKDTVETLKLDSLLSADLDSVVLAKGHDKGVVIDAALAQARNVKNNLTGTVSRTENIEMNLGKYAIEKYKKYSQAFACIVMFLIGAPLGAIIKKGGLGMPVIISIFFFIVYYVLSISGEEYAKAGVMEGKYSVWLSNMILLPVGLFFLRQARIDARLFDKDIYIIWWDKLITKYWSRKKLG